MVLHDYNLMTKYHTHILSLGVVFVSFKIIEQIHKPFNIYHSVFLFSLFIISRHNC
jgi:hypothetical protein